MKRGDGEDFIKPAEKGTYHFCPEAEMWWVRCGDCGLRHRRCGAFPRGEGAKIGGGSTRKKITNKYLGLFKIKKVVGDYKLAY